MAWTVETLNAKVDAELAALPAEMRARFSRMAGLVEAVGLEQPVGRIKLAYPA